MMLPPTVLLNPSVDFEIVDPIRDSRWDAWTRAEPDASAFHTSNWARVLAETYGFTPSYLSGLDTHGKRWLLPLMEVNSWLTGRRGVSLPFSDEVRTIGAPAGLSPDAFAKLRAHARSRGWKSVECRTGLSAIPGIKPSSTYYAHELDIQDGDGVTYERFHPSVRRAIRKAEKSGLTTELTTSEAGMRDYFRLHCLTRRRHGLPPQPYRFFAAVRRHILEAGLGTMVLVRSKGQAVAGVVFFRLGSGALFKFGAADHAFQAERPTNLALWRAIQHFTHEGCTRMHFGRNGSNHLSLRRFKLSWGTTEYALHYTHYRPSSDTFIADRNLLDGWQNHIFRSLPLGLSRLIGSTLYRHIA